MHKRSLLRQLTRVPLEKPCDSAWESMAGTDRVRHCSSCDRDVYSLSDMTELEAELRLLNADDAVPCIRYARDPHGRVLHLAEPRRPYLSSPSARALMVASALGTGLVGGDAAAQQKAKAKAAEPVQCVMLTDPAPAPASASAANNAPAPSPAAAAAVPPAQPPPPPIPLAGAAPPPREQVAYGTLTVRSKQPREIEVQGIKLQAPLGAFRMTPGNFVLKVEKRTIKFTIKLNQQTTIDLDKAS